MLLRTLALVAPLTMIAACSESVEVAPPRLLRSSKATALYK